MSAQFNDFSAYTQQFAAIASRVNRLALENAESAFSVGVKTFERNAEAVNDYVTELAAVRDLDGYKTLWPKGLQLARDNTERLVAAQQEFFGLSLKTGEAFGALAKSQIESATDSFNATVAKAAKATKTA
ncbi:MAG: phasin family protein, partial [Pseudoxanthomonas sp.]